MPISLQMRQGIPLQETSSNNLYLWPVFLTFQINIQYFSVSKNTFCSSVLLSSWMPSSYFMARKRLYLWLWRFWSCMLCFSSLCNQRLINIIQNLILHHFNVFVGSILHLILCKDLPVSYNNIVMTLCLTN